MKYRLAICMVAGLPVLGFGQSSFFSGTTGSSLLITPSKEGQLQFDSSTSLLHVQYFPARATNRVARLGFDLSGKPSSSGSSVLWTSGALGANLGLEVALRTNGLARTKTAAAGDLASDQMAALHHPNGIQQEPGSYDEFALEGFAGSSSNKLYTPGVAGASAFTNKSLTSWSYSADYWIRYQAYTFFGFRGGLAHGSNVDELTSQNFVTGSTIGGNPVSSTQSAFLASKYMEGNFAPLRADLMWQIRTSLLKDKDKDGHDLFRNISLDGFASKNTVDDTSWIPGFAILLTQPGGSTAFLGGISATWKSGKATYAIVTGLTF